MHPLSNRRFDQPAARQWALVVAAGDGNTLYLCARTVLYRIPLLVSGVRP